MKRLIGLAAALFLLVGCANPLPIPTMPSFAPMPSETAKPKPTVTLAPDAYTLREEVYEEEGVAIRFPQVAEDNYSRAGTINTRLQMAAEDDYTARWETEGLVLSVDWQAGRQDEVLSVFFTGEASVEGAVHPNAVCYAITLDMANVRVRSLADYITSREDVEEAIAAGGFALRHGDTDVFDTEAVAELVSAFFNAAPAADNVRTFYLEADETVCLILEVPHAAGDYIIIAIV